MDNQQLYADRRHLFDGLSKIDLPGSQLTSKSLPAIIIPILISKRVSIDNNNDNGKRRTFTCTREGGSSLAISPRPPPPRHCYTSLKNACNNAANFLHALITDRGETRLVNRFFAAAR